VTVREWLAGMSDDQIEVLTLSDHFSLLKMDWLTTLGQSILPSGHWTGHELSGSLRNARGQTNDSTDHKRRIFLTFDDGPNPHTTRKLLDLLDEEDVKATFFLIGNQIERYPALAKEIFESGHGVGSHSFSHFYLPMLDLKSVESEIIKTNQVYKDQVGANLTLFRPPYGILDQRAADILQEQSMQIVYWGTVPEDWNLVGSEHVAKRVAERFADGQLIVLHEGATIADQTIAATREIIKRGKSKGFHFEALTS
jgi:peptidoglycan/xylan/chitin deacetylase (PgdA/CDA1 family)